MPKSSPVKRGRAPLAAIMPVEYCGGQCTFMRDDDMSKLADQLSALAYAGAIKTLSKNILLYCCAAAREWYCCFGGAGSPRQGTWDIKHDISAAGRCSRTLRRTIRAVSTRCRHPDGEDSRSSPARTRFSFISRN